MDNEKNPQGPQIKLDLKPEIAAGIYSNFALISHARSEFVIDFAAMLPGQPNPSVNSRIIMAPEHAKRLLAALSDNIKKYEQNFGPIDMNAPQPQQKAATFNLGDLAEFGGKGNKS
ncbi:MAG: DUF3467 domain-containing protein [Bacteroidales bacterium]|nr:DUF3467 domain-containing protein [Bacteroidales bacterium]